MIDALLREHFASDERLKALQKAQGLDNQSMADLIERKIEKRVSPYTVIGKKRLGSYKFWGTALLVSERYNKRILKQL